VKAIIFLVLGVLFSVSGYADEGYGNVLTKIKNRGHLICGVNVGLKGFSEKDSNGIWSGFDVEFCKALSVAIFNEADRVEYIGLTGKDRFNALEDGIIDVLYRNSTMTATRDISLNIVFAGINYYDGQGFMVRNDRGIQSAYKTKGSTFCVTDGTVTLSNLVDFLKYNDLSEETKILRLQSSQEIISNLNSGFCNVATSDQSQLYSQRLSLNKPDNFLILPEVISKEPLGPAVKKGDAQWFSIVRWTLNAMIEAEFLGVSSKNIIAVRDSEASIGSVERLLGKKGGLGNDLGLSNEWAFNVIAKIGNYGEVFERTLGSQSDLGIARGLNAQWNEGGILYSSPF
jgi:general L-amino acid transport system substrate-binding protein